jgi:ribonuclease BN (tRNA processing enzyme)
VPAFGYRFDARDRSIVISGDTAPSENLVKLARGADVLVHSVMYPQAIDRLVSRVPNAAALKESILVPADDPQVTERMWIDAAQSRFHGKIILGRDLLEI